jgi:hypothetical protein
VGLPVLRGIYVAIADRYVRDIVVGRIVACGWVVKAARRTLPAPDRDGHRCSGAGRRNL